MEVERVPVATEHPRVLVAMSGGVDSSVAAALLKRQGYVATGVIMKIWGGDFAAQEGKHHGCYGPGEEEDIRDAVRVSEILDIPLQVIDLRQEYKSVVLDYFSEAYLSGRTPNPCVRCNRQVKFGALFEKASQLGLEFDLMASGHYAQVEYDESNQRYLLKKGLDIKKDQSYFLAFLSQKQLSHLVLPLGRYTKEEVRKMAGQFGLPVAGKPDSQNFVSGDYSSLLNGEPVAGPIQDKRGKVLGQHRGTAFYTIGQHRGLGISGEQPLYVTAIDACLNTLTVGPRNALFNDELTASELNWISIPALEHPMSVKAKIRSSHQEAEALLTPLGADKVAVKLKEPQMAITPGQAVVFYAGDSVVGGGIID